MLSCKECEDFFDNFQTFFLQVSKKIFPLQNNVYSMIEYYGICIDFVGSFVVPDRMSMGCLILIPKIEKYDNKNDR